MEDVADRVGVARIDGTGAAVVHLSDGGPPAIVTDKLRVYRQDAAGKFGDATLALGLPRLDFVHAVAPGDYDGDGDLDLYAVRGWMEPGGAVVDGALWFDMPFRGRGSFATRFRARGDLVLELQDAGPRRPPAPHPELLRLGAARHAVAALPWRGRADDPRLAGAPALDPRRTPGSSSGGSPTARSCSPPSAGRGQASPAGT